MNGGRVAYLSTVVAEFQERISPRLMETGRVERGEAKPFPTQSSAENFHALEMLTYTHRGWVDAIYIDPPQNGPASRRVVQRVRAGSTPRMIALLSSGSGRAPVRLGGLHATQVRTSLTPSSIQPGR